MTRSDRFQCRCIRLKRMGLSSHRMNPMLCCLFTRRMRTQTQIWLTFLTVCGVLWRVLLILPQEDLPSSFQIKKCRRSVHSIHFYFPNEPQSLKSPYSNTWSLFGTVEAPNLWSEQKRLPRDLNLIDFWILPKTVYSSSCSTEVLWGDTSFRKGTC